MRPAASCSTSCARSTPERRQPARVLEQRPRPGDVLVLGARSADREAQHRAAVEDGAGEQRDAARVGGGDQRLGAGVGGVRIVVAAGDAQQVQRVRGDDVEALVLVHPAGQRVGEADVAADHLLDREHAVEAQHEPQLEGPEPAAERDLPVAVVDGPGVGGRRTQVLGQDAQGAEQRAAVGGPVQAGVEADAHPLVRVGDVAVGALEPGVHPAVLLGERGDAAHRRVDVQPHALGRADLADLDRRIEGQRARRAVGRAHERRHQPGGAVGGDHLGERRRTHRVRRVVGHDAQVAEPGDAHVLLEAGVRL